jgi:hypothetical protein
VVNFFIGVNVRIVKDIPDIQRALNDLFGWKDRLSTKPWDFHQLRITNAAPGVDPNDYAILSQIPTVPKQVAAPVPPYTIVFESGTIITAGSNVSPGFVAYRGRTGIPLAVWVWATNLPTTGPLTVNVQINGQQLLDSDLSLNVGDTVPAVSSTFAAPNQKLPYLGIVKPIIVAAGGAGLASIGVVIQLDGSM